MDAACDHNSNIGRRNGKTKLLANDADLFFSETAIFVVHVECPALCAHLIAGGKGEIHFVMCSSLRHFVFRVKRINVCTVVCYLRVNDMHRVCSFIANYTNSDGRSGRNIDICRCMSRVNLEIQRRGFRLVLLAGGSNKHRGNAEYDNEE